jgi:hypothetical protein
LFDAISDYKQGRNKFESAKIITEILANNTKHYPSYLEAEIDNIELKANVKEYHRQQYLNTLTGKELEKFRLVERYDYQNSKAIEARKVYLELNNQSKVINSQILVNNAINNVKLADSKVKVNPQSNLFINLGENVKTTIVNDINSKETVNLATVNQISSDELEVSQKIYLREQAQAEQLAYEVERQALDSKGMQFFEYNNEDKIRELQEKHKLESSKETVNTKLLTGLEKQINFLTIRQEQIKARAESGKCIFLVKEYAKTKDVEVAANIRANITGDRLYNKHYYLAKENSLNLNDVLANGERFELSKLNLTPDEKQCFARVGKYIELTRMNGNELAFDELMARKYTMTKLAHEVAKEPTAHKQALEFYHIATKIDEETPKYQLKNREYLEKQGAIYSAALELVDNYRNEEDVIRKRQLAYQLTRTPYYAHQHKLIEQNVSKDERQQMVDKGKYYDLINKTAKEYKAYKRLDDIYKDNKKKELFTDKTGNYKAPSLAVNEALEINAKKLNILVYDNVADRVDNVFKNEKPAKIKTYNHIQGLMVHYGYEPYKINVTKEKVEEARESWQEIQGARNEVAYNIRETEKAQGVHELSNIYYELDNNERIAELENKKQDLTDNKEISKINNRIDRLTKREGYIENHANIHKCHLYMEQYQSQSTPQNASKVRSMFEHDLYGVCYGMAKSRDINFNELLTLAEKYDRKKLYLSFVALEEFDNIKDYLALSRKDSADFSYIDKSENIYKQGILARNILGDLDKHKEALDFYQFNKDDGALRHEVKAFDKLNNLAQNLERVENLVEQYKEAKDIDTRLEIAEQLNDKQLQFVKTGYLNSSKDLKEIRYRLYSDSIKIKVNKAVDANIAGAGIIREYLDSVESSRDFWKFYINDSEDFDKETRDGLKELAVEQNEKRNELAHIINSNKEKYQEILEIAKINIEYLEKHSSKYKELNTTNGDSIPDDLTLSAFEHNRREHIDNLSSHYSQDGINDWLIGFEDIVAEGKRLSPHSLEIKNTVNQDATWIKKLTAFNTVFDKKDIDQNHLKWANTTYKQTRGLTKDSPAYSYLSSRGIDINELDNIRWGMFWNSELEKKVPTIVYVARDKSNSITCCQKIYLRQLSDGTYTKYDQLKAENKIAPNEEITKLKIPKCNAGILMGSSCCISNGTKDSDSVILCEGVEDAASIWQAESKNTTQRAVFSSLGANNLSNFDLPKEHQGKDIIIYSDNDGVNANSNKVVADSAKTLALKGYNVYLTKPSQIDGKKTDANDVLIKKGEEQIQKDLEAAVLVEPAVTKETIVAEIKGEPTLVTKTQETISMDDIRKDVVNGINDTDKLQIKLDAIETKLDEHNSKDIREQKLEIAAYKILAEQNKGQSHNYKDLEEMLFKGYEEIDSKIVPLGINMKEQLKFEEQRACIAKTIQIINPKKELPEKMQTEINNYDEKQRMKLEEHNRQAAQSKLDKLQTKIIDIFQNNNVEPGELLSSYRGLTDITKNGKSALGKENIDNAQELTKIVAREVQANSKAWEIVKNNNMTDEINKSAGISLQDGIVEQYLEYKAEFDSHNGTLPNPFDKEACARYRKVHNDMLHLANVINQRDDVKNNLSIDIVNTIQKQAIKQRSSQNMDISHVSIRQGKGFGYSLGE